MKKTIKIFSIVFFILISIKLFSNELDLSGAVEIALKHNRDLQISSSEILRMKEIQKEQSAAFYPSITFSTQYVRLSDVSRIEMPMISREMGSKDNYEARLSVKYLLFSWWSVTNNVRASELTAQSSHLSMQLVKEMVVYSTAMSFYRTLLYYKVLETKKESLKRENDHYKTVQNFVEQGRASRFDLLKARVQLEEISAQVIQSENDYKVSMNQLKLLLGLNLDDNIILKGELENISNNEENNIDDTLNKRADLAILKLKDEILKLRLKIINAENKPRIYLFADGFVNYPYLMDKKWGFNWMAGVKLEINVFDGLAIKHRYNSTNQSLKQNEIRITDTVLNIRSEIKEIKMNLTNSKKILDVRKRNISLAEEALNIAKISYKNGVVTNLDVLTSELGYLNAKLLYFEALYKVILGNMNLKKARGVILMRSS